MIKALNVTRFSLPICDVIATRQRQRKDNKTASRMAEEREIIKPPSRSSVWKHFGLCKDGDWDEEMVVALYFWY